MVVAGRISVLAGLIVAFAGPVWSEAIKLDGLKGVLAGRYTNEMVQVVGRTGHVVETGEMTTGVYTLTDKTNRSIHVRTNTGLTDLDLGLNYTVVGTVQKDPKYGYLIVEYGRERVKKEVAPPPQYTEVEVCEISGLLPGRNCKSVVTKQFPASSVPTDVCDQCRAFPLLLVIGIGTAVLLAVIIVAVLSESRAKQRRDEEERARLESVERERAAAASARSATAEVPITSTPQHKGTLETWAILEVIKGSDAGRQFPLFTKEAKIGRESGDVILSNDHSVSSEHGSVVQGMDGRVLYIDSSRNGSRVNNVVVHRGQAELHTGDTIEVGTTTLKFKLLAAPAGSAPASDSVASKETVDGMQPADSSARAATADFLGAELQVTDGPDHGAAFPITKSRTTVGRMDGQDVQLTDPTASREHFVIVAESGSFKLVNKSKNGTKVGGAIAEEQTLNDGDEIRVGGTVLTFRKL